MNETSTAKLGEWVSENSEKTGKWVINIEKMSEGASERTSEKTSEWFRSNSLVLSLTHSFSHNLSLDTSFVFLLFSHLLTPISRVRKITGEKTNEAIREKCKKRVSKRNDTKMSEWVNERIMRKRASKQTRKIMGKKRNEIANKKLREND